MALNPKLSNEAASAEANAVVALIPGGKLVLYDGSQPTTADDATGAVTTLATFTLATPAAPSASNGVASFTAPASVTAAATGTASWFRVYKSDGSTPIFDGSVGTSSSNIVLNSTAIQIGATVSVSSFSFTAQKG